METNVQTNLTPLMKQYWEIKSLHSDKILLFRMGDFYEMFYDDAVKAAPLLGIALTSRNKKGGDETPMCGMPHHSVAGPINKLLAAGLKVALCDQLEDPKSAKGIVKRGVTRVMTPGMVYDVDTLNANQPHYLAALDDQYLSLLDTSTGEFFCIEAKTLLKKKNYLDSLTIAEIVISTEQRNHLPPFDSRIVVTLHERLKKLPNRLSNDEPQSAQRLLSYVSELSHSSIESMIKPLEQRATQGVMQIPSTSLRHLEVFKTYRGEEQGSLFHSIDRTKTSIGARLLRQWILFPLIDTNQIIQRQNEVQKWRDRLAETKRIREILSQMGDLERRLSKIVSSNCNARDLLSLAHSLSAGCSAISMSSYRETEKVSALANEILRTIVEEPPLSTKQGHLIQKGISSHLDEMIDLTTNTQSLLMQMEMHEREKTGISSLKIRYNNVFGYYIEVTHTNRDKVPSHYLRKQTLANAERFCTDELVELERKILTAQAKRADLESEIFEDLRKKILNSTTEILKFSHECALLDVYTSLAWISIEQRYVRPEFRDSGISIQASRHPVVEQLVSGEFIANDIEIKNGQCLLLTGPNMAGKSTLMRQIALTSILAQMGSFVPATNAVLCLFDSVYTRIGASDQLSEGLSTFMVEMTETAEILKSMTTRSLVVLDEIGRGTSTFDGMCLAQSILEYVLAGKNTTCLFATHYHELSALDRQFPQLLNAHMSVSHIDGKISFLHTLVKGAAKESYGIQVAELAGVPSVVTDRAFQLLRRINPSEVKTAPAVKSGQRSEGQLSLL